MKLSLIVIALLGLMFGPAAAQAQTPAAKPTPVPYVTPDFGSMKFFVGTWTCHGQVRGSDRPNTIVYTLSSDNQWLRYHDNAPVFDAYRTRPIVTDGGITFDATAHKWVDVSTDDFGNYGITISDGWNGNQIVWRDATPLSTVMNASNSITKTSDTELQYVRLSTDKKTHKTQRITSRCTKQ